MEQRIDCVMVDDEPLAQELIQQYLEEIPSLRVVGVFQNGLEAMEFLQQNTVHILFLDLNMPKLGGLDLLRSLQHPPVVIITTAYREYALEAYDMDVVDYLEKPFSLHRFLRAIGKAREKLASRALSPVAEPSAKPSRQRYFFVRVNKRSIRIELDRIQFVESLGDYVKIHQDESSLVVHTTLKRVCEWLPADEFPRIHKSYIVSLAKVELVDGNRVKVNGQELPIGNLYRKEFAALLESTQMGG